jgi:hypothetical protein
MFNSPTAIGENGKLSTLLVRHGSKNPNATKLLESQSGKIVPGTTVLEITRASNLDH